MGRLTIAMGAITAVELFLAGCAGAGAPVGSHTPGTSPTAVVSTVAGSGTAASVDGSGTGASFNGPTDIAFDTSTGVLYVLEPRTPAVRALTVTGTVSTLTHGISSPAGLAYNPLDANLYVSESATSAIARVTTAGVVSHFANVATSPSPPPEILGEMSADSTGNLYVTENRAGNVVTITPSMSVTKLGASPGVDGSCFDPNDNGVYVINQAAGELDEIASSGVARVADSTLLQGAVGITYDGANGVFYVANPSTNQILSISNAQVYVMAGNGSAGEVDGGASSAEFNGPTGIAYDGSMHALFVTDAGGNTVRRITSFE